MSTLYWHDYETFGADPARDRPAQFAGVRTSEDLEEVGEPLLIYCRPPRDYLPQPEACQLTGITPRVALERGLSEPEFIGRIHGQLARPGTCGVGYNSLRFDDEVTRYALYRNFFEPYGREWQHGNSRWDLIDVMRMAYAFRPDGIEWPLDDGVPSFRLERLTTANGIAHQGAHDALADVRATIELARRLKRAQPKLYRYAFGLRRKQEALKYLGTARPRPVLHVSSRFPAARGCTSLVLPLMKHPTNGNGVVVCDLSRDPEEMMGLDAPEIFRRLYLTQDQLKEEQRRDPSIQRVPLKTVHINRSPMLVTPDIIDEAGYARIGIDRSECEARAGRILAGMDALRAKIAEQMGVPRQWPDRLDAESRLYDGFIGDGDRALMDRVRQASPGELAHWTPPFADQRLTDLYFRYRARNFPESLSVAEAAAWEQWRLASLAEPGGGRPGIADYCRQLEDRLSAPAVDAHSAALCRELLDYAHSLAGPAAAGGQVSSPSGAAL